MNFELAVSDSKRGPGKTCFRLCGKVEAAATKVDLQPQPQAGPTEASAFSASGVSLEVSTRSLGALFLTR